MKTKYIFIDIDGTLFDHSTNSVPQSAIEAIRQASQNGHKIFLCTGRGFPEVGDDFSFLPLDGMILSCGANIRIGNQTLFLSRFPYQALQACVHFMRTHKIGFSLDGETKSFLDKEAYDLFQGIALKKAQNDSELARALLNESHMYHFSLMQEEDYHHIMKISLFSHEYDPCQALINQLPDTCTGFIRHEPNQPLIHGEISIKGVHKATGMQKVLDYYHANIEDSIALGDSLNDLEMMKFAGYSICMGNGDAAVKKESDFVTRSVNEDGLAFAFKACHLIWEL